MGEALYRIDRVERLPGPLGFHLAVAVVGQVWPIGGMLLFDWDILAVAFAYWGGLGAFLLCGVARILPVSRPVAGFFALHGGVFWLASLQLIASLRDPTVSVWAIGWPGLLGVAALSAGTVVLQEGHYGHMESRAGRRVEGFGLAGRYYWRFGLLAFLIFMLEGTTSPRSAGWLLVGISTAVDCVTAVVRTLWPLRVVRNLPATDAVAQGPLSPQP